MFLFLEDERVPSKLICCWEDVQVGKMIRIFRRNSNNKVVQFLGARTWTDGSYFDRTVREKLMREIECLLDFNGSPAETSDEKRMNS